MYSCTQNSVWLCVVMVCSPLSLLFISGYCIWKNKEIIAVKKQVAGKIWMSMNKMMQLHLERKKNVRKCDFYISNNGLSTERRPGLQFF